MPRMREQSFTPKLGDANMSYGEACSNVYSSLLGRCLTNDEYDEQEEWQYEASEVARWNYRNPDKPKKMPKYPFS